MSKNEAVTIHELIIEYHRIIRQSLCTHQDDDVVCFDYIVIITAIINSCKYLIRDNVCKVNSSAQNKIVYKITPSSRCYIVMSHNIVNQTVMAVIVCGTGHTLYYQVFRSGTRVGNMGCRF